jgi:CDGSH-type Zn-finger protein
VVHGHIPLVHKEHVVSEYGEPLTWRTGHAIETPETYELCRCGHSKFPPFCDVSHALVEFDGTETAETDATAERRVTHEGGPGIVVRRDYSLCTNAGFCGTRLTNVEEMARHSEDTGVRSQIMAMVERCPSGSYTYALAAGEADIEPDLPQQIAVTTEITDDGRIAGPLWVTGNIPIERADGKPLETRNRVTLCCCGLSKSKPLCDGTHRCRPVQSRPGLDGDED